MRGSTKRIFIVERNPHVRDFFRRELAKRNYQVRGTRHGDEIFAAVNSPEPPDLIILSADFPDEGKEGVLRRLSSDYPHIPVVLHVYQEESAEQEVVRFAAGVVEKNGNPERLFRKVDALIGHAAESDGRSDSEEG